MPWPKPYAPLNWRDSRGFVKHYFPIRDACNAQKYEGAEAAPVIAAPFTAAGVGRPSGYQAAKRDWPVKDLQTPLSTSNLIVIKRSNKNSGGSHGGA